MHEEMTLMTIGEYKMDTSVVAQLKKKKKKLQVVILHIIS